MFIAPLVDSAYVVHQHSAVAVIAPFSTVQVASLFVGVFLPILVGLVTKVTTSSTVKSILLLALSAVSGFLTEFIDTPDHFVWQQALLTSLVTFITGVAMHYGLWKPTGTTQAAQRSLVKDPASTSGV